MGLASIVLQAGLSMQCTFNAQWKTNIIPRRYWQKRNMQRKGRKKKNDFWSFLICSIPLPEMLVFPPRKTLQSRQSSTKKSALKGASREDTYTHPSFWVDFPECCLSCLLNPHGRTFLFIKTNHKNLPLCILEPAAILSASGFQIFYCKSHSLLHTDFVFGSAFISQHWIESAGPLGVMQHWKSSCAEFCPFATQHDPCQYYAQCKQRTFPDWEPTDYYSSFKAYQQSTCSHSSSQILPEDNSQQLQTKRGWYMVILDVLFLFAVVSAKLQARTQNDVNQKKNHILMIEEHSVFGQCC